MYSNIKKKKYKNINTLHICWYGSPYRLETTHWWHYSKLQKQRSPIAFKPRWIKCFPLTTKAALFQLLIYFIVKLLIRKCVHCHLGEIERGSEMEGKGDCGKCRDWEVIIRGRGWRSERGGVRKMWSFILWQFVLNYFLKFHILLISFIYY